jgi:hypothetical protein
MDLAYSRVHFFYSIRVYKFRRKNTKREDAKNTKGILTYHSSKSSCSSRLRASLLFLPSAASLAGPTVAEYNVIRISTALRGLFEVDTWEHCG